MGKAKAKAPPPAEGPKAPKKKGGKKDKTPEPAPELTQREISRQQARASRAVVASSSSWTGKLPATLLFEHCQKLKWEKVTFDAAGFVVTAVLGQKNPKTGQVEHVRFTPPADVVTPQETALEARHFAATYALHRIASFRNMTMLLPGPHKDLWRKLDEIKKTDKDAQWNYAQDPFQAARDRKQHAEQRVVERKAQAEARESTNIARAVRDTIKAEEEAARSSTPSRNGSPANGETGAVSETTARGRRVRFNHELPMARSARSKVEKVIRRYHGFALSGSGLKKSDPRYDSVRSTLVKLGFASFQAEEALDHETTLSQCLKWLLIHVPEDDLPKLFRGGNVGVTANVSGDAQLEQATREISKFGFSAELVREALIATSNSKRLAVVHLVHVLVYPEAVVDDADDGARTAWDEEMEALEALHDKDFKNGSDGQCTISATLSKGRKVQINFYRSESYPQTIPGITIGGDGSANVPRYVLLDVIRRAGKYAAENYSGDFMIDAIYTWIKDHFAEIERAPSKLSEIAGGVSGVYEMSSEKKKVERKRRTAVRKVAKDSQTLKTEREQQINKSDKLQQMIKARQNLPAWRKKEEISRLINQHQVVLITGETGSGKSTQVVQFVLDDLISNDNGQACSIICTQPRRISAMGVAQRVADERDTPIGDVVGYSIRGESKVSKNTQIQFVTSGVLLRMIQSDPVNSLEGISHVFVDEVHERSLDSDFLLILLRRLAKKKKDLKIVLMSATVDPKQFISYFGNDVGYAHIEGRTFPVKDIFLEELIPMVNFVPSQLREQGVSASDVGRIIVSMKDGLDYSLVADTVDYIDRDLGSEEGSILVFMSGAAEIDRSIRAIKAKSGNRFVVYPLHSSLSPAEQRLVFTRAPKHQRKVVVSTNIAETSITIDDIVAVVDSGRVKETVYSSQSNAIQLVDMWASQAAVTQRRGRAGRVRPGTCYRLFTSSVFEKDMTPRPAPEMLRAPLQQMYLSTKAMGVSDVPKFLSEALDPPDTGALETARMSLLEAGVLDAETDALTALGKHISAIPADVQCAKLLILSAVFGCLSKGLTVAATLSVRPPFFSPREKRDEAKAAMMRFAGEGQGQGDLIAYVAAFDEWRTQRQKLTSGQLRAWCQDNFLSPQTLFDISSARRQLLATLQETGFVTSDNESKLAAEFNAQDGNDKLFRAVLGASMTPNIAEIVFPEKTFKAVSSGAIEQDPNAREIRFFNKTERVFVHPGSSLFGANKFAGDSTFLAYASKMTTTKLYISGVTPVSSYGTALFSDTISVDPLGAGVICRGWCGLKCWPRTGVLVEILKDLFNEILNSKFSDPSRDITSHEILTTVRGLIESDGAFA